MHYRWRVVRRGRLLSQYRSAGSAGIRATALSGCRLYLDSGLLGLYENYDYYWVPGVWVPPPRVGLLWTPPWWGWNNGAYVFNQGYWGPTVGFYGGINYGYGYTGNGYWGGRWSGNTFQYNTAVTRVNTNIVHNTYINNSFEQTGER